MDVSQALDIINTVKQPQAKALSDLIGVLGIFPSKKT